MVEVEWKDTEDEWKGETVERQFNIEVYDDQNENDGNDYDQRGRYQCQK